MNKQFKFVLRAFIGPFIILLLWYILHRNQVVNPALLPSPIDVLKNFIRLFYEGKILTDLGYSISRMIIGFSIATVIGILLGLFIGISEPVYEAVEGMIDFFRSIPVTTLYPIFVLFFGIDHLSKIAMVIWASVFVIMLNSAYGVRQSGKLRIQMAQLYGASKNQIFKWIVFYNALPQTIIGLRVAISFSLIVEILCEMFMGSEFGLGQRITEAYTTFSMKELFALILIAGILGYLTNRMFTYIEKKLTYWV